MHEKVICVLNKRLSALQVILPFFIHSLIKILTKLTNIDSVNSLFAKKEMLSVKYQKIIFLESAAYSAFLNVEIIISSR